MKIVIDIPEAEYELIVNDEACGLNVLTRAIANGTPLPKGHGELVDADELLEKQYRIDDSVTLSTRDVVNVEDVEDAPTIIEADKIESEKEE